MPDAHDVNPDAAILPGDATDAAPDAPVIPQDLVALCGAMPSTIADWEACYQRRYCAALLNCSEQNLYTDAQECVSLADAVTGGKYSHDAFERQRAIAAGRASIDEATFTECLRALDPLQCSSSGKPAACPLRYDGTIADGQGCYTDVECASPGARCVAQDCDSSCCLGVCQRRAKLGETCMDFEACEPGLVCSLTSQKCVGGDINQPCAGRYDCDPGAYCDSDSQGTCRADLGPGQACSSLLQCGGETSCVGLKRSVEPPKCRRVTEVGDACDWYCLGNLYCDLSSPTGFGVCRALPTTNQACGALTPCVGRNLRCSNGTCVARPDVGGACSDGTCRPGLFCTDQLGAASPVCSSRLPDSAGCNRPTQCQSFVCDGDVSAGGNCRPLQATCP